MAVKYRIQMLTQVPIYTGTEVTGYTNAIDNTTNVAYDIPRTVFTFDKNGGSGMVPREQVLFVLPYDDGE